MGRAELDARIRTEGPSAIPCEEMAAWIVGRRWFGAKSKEFAQFNVLDVVVLEEGPPLLALALIEARMHSGTHELYQLPIVTREDDDAHGQAVIARAEGAAICDALQDAHEAARLGQLIAAGAVIERDGTTVHFSWDGEEPPSPMATVRVMDVEQSNSSVVFDERLALKAFRRIEAGTNPEVEMLRFLDAHGFANIARLEGSYTYHGELIDSTLGIVQRFIPHAGDGWALALSAIEEGRGDEFLSRLGDLGAITGRMHAVLASDHENPDFSPDEPSEEHVALISATIDEQIERTFIAMPELEALAPLNGRSQELRERLRQLSSQSAGGLLIRIHGDYHLGQAVFGAGGWTVLDFEGEPGRPMRERRRKRSPLRDVAGMLRSLTYAALAGELLYGGRPAPPGWEARARELFLAGYMREVDRRLLPGGSQAIAKLLTLFELEKLLYELRYELDNRPEWVSVPVAAIGRLLEEPVA